MPKFMIPLSDVPYDQIAPDEVVLKAPNTNIFAWRPSPDEVLTGVYHFRYELTNRKIVETWFAAKGWIPADNQIFRLTNTGRIMIVEGPYVDMNHKELQRLPLIEKTA